MTEQGAKGVTQWAPTPQQGQEKAAQCTPAAEHCRLAEPKEPETEIERMQILRPADWRPLGARMGDANPWIWGHASRRQRTVLSQSSLSPTPGCYSALSPSAQELGWYLGTRRGAGKESRNWLFIQRSLSFKAKLSSIVKFSFVEINTCKFLTPEISNYGGYINFISALHFYFLQTGFRQ